MLGLEAGHSVLAGTMDDQTRQIVSDIQCKIKDLQSQLVEVCRRCSVESARAEAFPVHTDTDMGEHGAEQDSHRPIDIDIGSEDPLLQAARDFDPSQALRSAEELARQVGAMPIRERPGPYSGAKVSKPGSGG